MKIYTMGYLGWTLDDMEATAVRLDAVFVDVRMQPRSRIGCYNSGVLHQRFGERYQWVRELGNVNYKGGPIQFLNLEAGAAKVRALLDTGKPVILLCGCPKLDECHRKILADTFAADWTLEVEHLTPASKNAKREEPTLF